MAKVQPAIVSVGYCEHASKRSDVNMAELVHEAIINCLEGSPSADWKDIDCIINGNMPAFEGANIPELWMTDHIAAKDKPFLRVTTGGTTGGSICIAAYYAVASGMYDTVLA
jgi:acetyl-CoA C-acetyltransferase